MLQMSTQIPRGQCFPWQSLAIVAGYVAHIVSAFSLPSSPVEAVASRDLWFIQVVNVSVWGLVTGRKRWMRKDRSERDLADRVRLRMENMSHILPAAGLQEN